MMAKWAKNRRRLIAMHVNVCDILCFSIVILTWLFGFGDSRHCQCRVDGILVATHSAVIRWSSCFSLFHTMHRCDAVVRTVPVLRNGPQCNIITSALAHVMWMVVALPGWSHVRLCRYQPPCSATKAQISWGHYKRESMPCHSLPVPRFADLGDSAAYVVGRSTSARIVAQQGSRIVWQAVSVDSRCLSLRSKYWLISDRNTPRARHATYWVTPN